MRNDLREEYENLTARIQSGKATRDQIQFLHDKLDAFVDAYAAAYDSAKRLIYEAKEYALLRDSLKEKLNHDEKSV